MTIQSHFEISSYRMNWKSLVLCSLLIATAKSYSTSLTLENPLQLEIQEALFLATKFVGCQFVILTDWSEYEASTFHPVEQLLPQLQEANQPTELWGNLDNFRRWTYTFKYVATKLAIVHIPPSYYGLRLEQIVLRMASKNIKIPYQTEQDLVVTVFESEIFTQLNLDFIEEKHVWFLPANHLLISYESENATRPMEIRAHRFRCPDYSDCLITLDCIETGSELSYESIMHELWLRRHNFNEEDVRILIPSPDDLHISAHTLLQPLRMRRKWMRKSFETIPFFYVAKSLNITLLPFIQSRPPLTQGWIIMASFISDADTCGVMADNCGAVFMNKIRDHKLIHPFAHQTVGAPSNLRSIQAPFEPILWILYAASILAVASLYVYKSKRRMRLLIGLVATFIGQGVHDPLGSKAKRTHASWLIFVIFMSWFYGSGIQSSRIKPQRTQVSVTFQQLIEQDCKFYASRPGWVYFRKNNQEYHMKYKEINYGADNVRELRSLKSRLSPADKNTEKLRDLILSGSTVWYVDHNERAAFESVMRDVLNLNFVYVKFSGQTATVWNTIEVAHGDLISTLYKKMIEAGWTEFWQAIDEKALLPKYIQLWIATLNADDDAQDVRIVSLENSLALEGLCLWGFGIAAGSLLFVPNAIMKGFRYIKARLQKRKKKRSMVQVKPVTEG